MAMKFINKIVDKGINLLLISFSVVALWIFFQVFFFASFRIPSDSMEPELTTGDNVLVNKLIIGPRLFNLFTSMRNEQEMHILKYYIKRCIGLPGDTLSIQNGYFHIQGVQAALGNTNSQKQISTTNKLGDEVYNSFPFDSVISWNIKNFGPLYIPAKGDSIAMNHRNFQLYKQRLYSFS